MIIAETFWQLDLKNVLGILTLLFGSGLLTKLFTRKEPPPPQPPPPTVPAATTPDSTKSLKLMKADRWYLYNIVLGIKAYAFGVPILSGILVSLAFSNEPRPTFIQALIIALLPPAIFLGFCIFRLGAMLRKSDAAYVEAREAEVNTDDNRA